LYSIACLSKRSFRGGDREDFDVANKPDLPQPGVVLNEMKSALTLVTCVGLAISGLAASTHAADPATDDAVVSIVDDNG